MKDLFDFLMSIIVVLLLASVPISFVNAITIGYEESPCNTYGYYLPVTFALCHLNQERPR